MKLRNLFSSLIIILLLLANIAIAATLRATVSRNPISLGQSFQLTIDLKGQNNFSRPDLQLLQRDFTILGTGQNQTVNIVNGTMTRTNQWILRLIPKHAGTLTIPRIRIGQSQTKPIVITVKKPAQINTSTNSPVFLQAVVNTKNPLIQSEVLYTLKLYYSVSIRNTSLIPPSAPNAIVKRIGDDQNYQAEVNGKLYNIFERRYVIFPKESGKLVLSPVILRGNVSTTRNSQMFSSFFLHGY